MSLLFNSSMTKHHAGMLSQIADKLHVWQERRHSRQELAQMSERDLHDVGLSSSDAIYEIDKPFWQA